MRFRQADPSQPPAPGSPTGTPPGAPAPVPPAPQPSAQSGVEPPAPPMAGPGQPTPPGPGTGQTMPPAPPARPQRTSQRLPTTPDALNAMLAAARRDGQQTAQREQQRATQEAQGQFQQLYLDEQLARQTAETSLQSTADELERYRTVVRTFVDEQLLKLPDSVKTLLPDPAADPLAVFEKLPAAFANLGQQMFAAPRGNAGDPPPTGGNQPPDVREVKDQLGRTGFNI